MLEQLLIISKNQERMSEVPEKLKKDLLAFKGWKEGALHTGYLKFYSMHPLPPLQKKKNISAGSSTTCKNLESKDM